MSACPHSFLPTLYDGQFHVEEEAPCIHCGVLFREVDPEFKQTIRWTLAWGLVL